MHLTVGGKHWENVNQGRQDNVYRKESTIFLGSVADEGRQPVVKLCCLPSTYASSVAPPQFQQPVPVELCNVSDGDVQDVVCVLTGADTLHKSVALKLFDSPTCKTTEYLMWTPPSSVLDFLSAITFPALVKITSFTAMEQKENTEGPMYGDL